MIETTALGAAGLAGIAGGVWRDAAEFIGTRKFTQFTPGMSREAADELVAGWDRAVKATLSWARDKGDDARAKKKKKRSGAAARKKSSSPGGSAKKPAAGKAGKAALKRSK